MKQELILGNIITMDEKRPYAKAVLVKNGVFAYIGSAEEAKKLAGADAQVLDYGDNYIYPRFLESHCHGHHSDFPVSPMMSVKYSIYMAEKRNTPKEVLSGICQPRNVKEAITREQSLRAMTIIFGMMLLGCLVGQDAKLDMVNSLFLAGMLCMSSTTIVMKAIDEAGMKKERFVKGATSILIVEDVVAVVLMVLLSSIAIRHQFEGAELINKVLILALTLAAWFITGILIIPTLLRLVKKHLNDETLIILALGLCLGMVLTAEEAGFSSALGAFVMGSILAETVESHRIEKLMTPLKNVFASIFFISVGMLIDPSSLSEYWMSIVYVSLVIIVGMILFATLGCWWGGATLRDSILTSFSFVQIGEFSFIIASLGTSLGVLNPIIYPIIVASSVVTTFLTPYIMKAAVPCYNFLYNHASPSLRAKIDRRELKVSATGATTESDGPSIADKVRHAVRHTFIMKRLVNLMIKNMSAHDENAGK